MSKIRAFTLYELLITLVISSLLLSLAFLALSNYQRIYTHFANLMELKTDKDLFEIRMNYLIKDAEKIVLENGNLMLINSEDSIYIEFDSTFTRVINKSIDSFEIEIKKIELNENKTILNQTIAMHAVSRKDTSILHFTKYNSVYSKEREVKLEN